MLLTQLPPIFGLTLPIFLKSLRHGSDRLYHIVLTSQYRRRRHHHHCCPLRRQHEVKLFVTIVIVIIATIITVITLVVSPGGHNPRILNGGCGGVVG